ncbi:MAG: hypothetical protein ACREER_10445 [Alphaproteobacteria bacterium]
MTGRLLGGRVALVTGGASGMGRAIGLALFLCSDAAPGLTMEDVRVSGGNLW